MRRGKRASEAEASLGSPTDSREKNFLKGICTKLLCYSWNPPECQFYKGESECKFGTECSFPHLKVEERPNKRPKKGGDKSAVAIVKEYDSWVVYRRTLSRLNLQRFFRKGTEVLGPIRRARFTRGVAASCKHPRKHRSHR